MPEVFLDTPLPYDSRVLNGKIPPLTPKMMLTRKKLILSFSFNNVNHIGMNKSIGKGHILLKTIYYPQDFFFFLVPT